MTRTARRRWSREMDGEIDGIAFGDAGPVLVHGYDPPAGGKWIDDVIPGKLGAYERRSGDSLWISPCEVGYGRGFGAGVGAENDAVVMGPSSQGHRIARMHLETGELIGAREIPPFDQGLVGGDLCVTVQPSAVTGILTSAMVDVWSYSRDGERYHLIGRDGGSVYAITTSQKARRQGLLRVDVESGELVAEVVPPELAAVHDLAVGGGVGVLVTGTVAPGGRGQDRLGLLGVALDGEGRVLWREAIPEEGLGGMPEVSVHMDAGRLYVARGAMLDVRDALTGRLLGEVAVPGLDEHVAWTVCQGAGLIAEENRASVYEIPD